MLHVLLPMLVQAGALAQEQEVQRALMQRDQQSAGFALQLRQSQEQLQPAPGDNRHLNERQRLENVSGQQLLDVKPDPPPAPRAYERQKAADERTFMLSPPVVKPRPLSKPAPLPAHPPAVPSEQVVPRVGNGAG
ncbi:MAG TPA: hypothetical protein VF876_16835 [Burkholderiales bacterium]